MIPKQKKMFRLLTGFAAAGLAAVCIHFLVSCGGASASDPDEPTSMNPNKPLPVPTSLNCPAGTSLSYENFGAQFLRRYCSGCHSVNLVGIDRHGAPELINFDSAADAVSLRVEMIRSAGADDARMPPGVSVLKDERALFREWLNCGAP